MKQAEAHKDLEAALDIFQVGQAAAGDRRAFDLLYRRWHPRLLRLASRLTGHADQAQDVLQEAALTIARDIHKLQEPSKFSAWAYTIIRRRAADHINKAVQQRKHERAVTAEATEMSDNDLALRQALSQLPETDRLMLTLFYQDGFKGTEIAAALGIPLGTVKSRLFKARADLKSIYMTTEGEENGL